jgi:hypothetical protein
LGSRHPLSLSCSLSYYSNQPLWRMFLWASQIQRQKWQMRTNHWQKAKDGYYNIKYHSGTGRTYSFGHVDCGIWQYTNIRIRSGAEEEEKDTPKLWGM